MRSALRAFRVSVRVQRKSIYPRQLQAFLLQLPDFNIFNNGFGRKDQMKSYFPATSCFAIL